MKNIKNILFSFSLIFVLFFAVSVFAEESNNKENINISNGQVIATVEIYNAKVTSQKDNTFTLDFDFYNKVGAQSNIKYAVQLVNFNKETGDTTLVHQKNYDEVVSLSQNETLHKKIKYTAPSYLEGNYHIAIVSENDKGIPFASALLQENVLLTGDGNSFVEIIPGKCFVKVGDVKYDALFGVDIDSGEEITVSCEIKNHFSEDIDVYPAVKTYRRTLFGEMVEKTESEESIKIEKNKTKRVNFVLKHPEKPQSYVSLISLKDKKSRIISNEENVRYVVRGNSATIQNVVFDKDYYEEGDIAKLSFLITGFADNFVGSRKERTNELENIQLELTIKSGQKVCAQSNQSFSGEKLPYINTEINILKKCVNPSLEVKIKDKNGEILDQSEFSVITKTNKNSLFENYGGILLLVVLVLILISAGIYSTRNNKNIINSILILFIIGVSSLLFAGDADAATVVGYVNNNGAKTWVVGSFSLNKSTYTVGENINMTVSSVRVITCNNNSTDSYRYGKLGSSPTATWVDPSLSNYNTLTITSGTKIGSTMYCGDTNGDHTYITCNFGIASKKLGTASSVGTYDAYFSIFAHTEKAWWAHGYIDTGVNSVSYNVVSSTKTKPTAVIDLPSSSPISYNVGDTVSFSGHGVLGDGGGIINSYAWVDARPGTGSYNGSYCSCADGYGGVCLSTGSSTLNKSNFSTGTHRVCFNVRQKYSDNTTSWAGSNVEYVDVVVGNPSPVCGNGIIEGSEECDDGNTTNGDGCSSTCLIEGGGGGGGGSFCGDGTCDPGEDTISCPADCLTPICGNGTCEVGETSFSCFVDCPPVCPNGTCDSGETSLNCSADCSPVCGNGLVEPLNNEECDDGNTTNGDGCSSTCLIEGGGGGGSVCGDGTCESDKGENYLNCSVDCTFNFIEI